MLGLRDPLGPCLEPTDPQHARSGVMGLDKVAQHGVGDHPKLGSPGIVIYCHILFSAFFLDFDGFGGGPAHSLR